MKRPSTSRTPGINLIVRAAKRVAPVVRNIATGMVRVTPAGRIGRPRQQFKRRK